MSTLKVNKIENTATTDGGIEIDNTGHVQIDGLQLPTAGPLSNRNLIINGAMQVAQRGTTANVNGYGTVDRFQCSYSGAASEVTQTQNTLTVNASNQSVTDLGFRHTHRMTVVTTTNGAGSFRRLMYFVEAQDIATSGWNYQDPNSFITISFWVRASVTQRYFLWVASADGTSQQYVVPIQDAGGTTLSANTWTQITAAIPGNANITINNDNGIGLQLNWIAFMGTDFTDAGVGLETWSAFDSGQRLPDMDDTWSNTVGAFFEITGVQLESGSVATPFEHRSYGDELARCQRYYEVHGVQLDTAQNGSGTAYATWNFKQTKRDTPSTASDAGAIASGSNVLSSTGWQIYGSASAVRMTVNAFVSSEL